jgi:hypothetical protein
MIKASEDHKWYEEGLHIIWGISNYFIWGVKIQSGKSTVVPVLNELSSTP